MFAFFQSEAWYCCLTLLKLKKFFVMMASIHWDQQQWNKMCGICLRIWACQHLLYFCKSVLNLWNVSLWVLFMQCILWCSDGKEWKDMRVLHHKQILPANVHSYSPGINRVTDRLLKTLESSRNEDGYVEDVFPHLLNWTMEGAW